MTNLTESSVWESGVYQLEIDDPTLGGPPGFDAGLPVTGHANAQAQQLANRSKYLKDAHESFISSLLNPVDVLEGANLVGRSIRQISSVAELRTISGRNEGDSVIVSGYFIETPNIGGGLFRWDSDSAVVDDGGLIIQPTGVPVGRWVRVFKDVVDVTWFGAISGVDSTSSLTSAHLSGYNVYYPAGHWIHSLVAGLPWQEGQSVYGAGGNRFTTEDKLISKLECTAAGGIYLAFKDTSVTGQVSGPSLYDCYVIADNGIAIGDISTLVTSQGLAMKSCISRNIFQARTPGDGVGLSMVGAFNFELSVNEFRQFDSQIIMIGCDIGDVHNNRMTFQYSYGILELSAAPSYGSQVKIRNNDILVGEQATTVMIRSTSQHVRIYDNYLEQGQARPNLGGFIDTSIDSPPIVGVNTTSAIQQSVFIENNRIDGHNRCNDFLYKINPSTVTTKLVDSGSSGTQDVNTTQWLTLGGDGLGLAVRYNVGNFCNWNISGGTGRFTQKFPQFVSKIPESYYGVFTIDSESVGRLDHAALNSNDGVTYLRVLPEGIKVLSTAGTTWIHLCPNNSGSEVVNDIFTSGKSYTVEIIAKSVIAGEAIFLGRSNGSGLPAGDVSVALNLTTQYQKFSTTITGQLETVKTGICFRRNNNNAGDVYIKSIVAREI